MQYTQALMDHFKNPRNQGSLPDADAVGEVGNMKCGDIMKVYLKIENDVIKDIKFETLGCAAAIANSSVLTELAMGLTLDEALKIDKKMIVEKLGGVPAPKFHCSILAEEALKLAIMQYREKNNL